jgi:hypothetical protein
MGGKKMPACGMALYVDELMKIIAPETANRNKIAIVCPDEHNFDISTLCNLTNSLYEAGYISEFGQINLQERYNWIITVNSQSEILDLTDIASGKKQKVDSIKNIIQLLERKR